MIRVMKEEGLERAEFIKFEDFVCLFAQLKKRTVGKNNFEF